LPAKEGQEVDISDDIGVLKRDPWRDRMSYLNISQRSYWYRHD